MNRVQEVRLAVVDEAMQWKGTPYHHGASIKGIGATCSGFIKEVFNRTTGSSLTVLDHAEQWYFAAQGEIQTIRLAGATREEVERAVEERQLYLHELTAQGFIEVPLDRVAAGDLALSRTVFDVFCHGGIITNWPKPASAIHCTTYGVRFMHRLYGSWHFAHGAGSIRYFSLGVWH